MSLPDQSPSMPVELQLLVLGHAADSLLHTAAFEANLRAFSLVSTAWKDKAQARLFETIDLDKVDSERLYASLEHIPSLGRLVENINMTASFRRTQNLLSHLHLLPNLHVVADVTWSPQHILVKPPPGLTRPKLRSLALAFFDDDRRGSRPNDWFNLTQLSRLQLRLNGNCLPGVDILSDVSESLRELDMRNAEAEDVAALFQVVRRFTALETLGLVVWRSTSALPSSAFLAPLRQLRRLTIAHEDIRPVLAHPHAALETIVVTMPPDDWFGAEEVGFPAEHPSSRNVAAIARVAEEDNVQAAKGEPKRFPALLTVGLSHPYAVISFKSEHGTMLTPGRAMFGLREMARALRAVGLRFVDAKGKVWRKEWDDA